MKKSFVRITFIIILFASIFSLKGQTLDSVATTDSIICNGGFGTVTAYMSQTLPGTPVKLLNYRYTSPTLLMSNGSSGVTTGSTQPFPGIIAASYRMLMVDSALFYLAFPSPPGPPQAELLNPTHASIFGYFDYTVSEPTLLLINSTVTNASTPFANDGSIILNVSGGEPGYTYSWLGPNGFFSSSQNINNLPMGTYQVTVTDNLGCPQSQTIVVGANQPCGITNVNVTNVLCYGDSLGVISVDGIFGVSPFNYSIEFLNGSGALIFSSTDTSFIFDSIPAGTYRIKLTDNVGCSDSIFPDISVGQPNPINISGLVTSTSAINLCDGAIQSVVSGGVQPYSYLWCDGQITSAAIGLCVGECCVIVTDNNGCTASYCDSIEVLSPCIDSIQLTVTVSPETCTGVDGSVQIFAVSGTSPYYYSIDGGFSFDTIGFTSSVLIDSLITGNYDVVVKDDSSCLTNYGVISLGLTPNPIIDSITIINESCCGSDGKITIFVQNPLAVLKYSIDTLFSWQGQDSATFSNLYRGDYLVHIQDTNFCIDSMDVYVGVDSVPNIDMTTQSTDIVCNGDTNGTFRVYYPDSCYDYVLWRYTLFNPQVPIDTGSYFNELIKGWYGIVATSKSGTCLDSSVIQYIDEPTLITYNEPISSAVYCMNNGVCNGSISLDGFPTGGIPPYQYYINEIYTNIPSGAIDIDSTFFDICPGEYEIHVVDANACVVPDTISVSDSSLYIDSFVVENSSCFGYDNGNIAVYAHGGLGSYSYLWSNGQNSQAIDSLSPGSYSVLVTDSAGCFALDTIAIIQPDTLLFKIIESGKISETCMGVTYDGQIFLEITGGTAPYNYSWLGNSGVSGFGFGDTMINLTYDTITISVYDSNGCIGSPSWGTIDMTVVDALNAVNPLILDSVLIGNSPMCFGSASGTLQIDINQGVAPYTYSIDNGVTQNLNHTFTHLIASPYNIVVYDVFGCTDSSRVVLEQHDEIVIGIDSLKHINCYDGNDGYISVSAGGGLGSFNYSWIPTFDTTPIITDLFAVPHMVQIIDSDSCMAFDTIILTEKDPIQVIDLIVNNTSCFNSEDGSAGIQIIGGMPFENNIYNIHWINSSNDTAAIGSFADSLISGIYLVTVTDSFLCGPFTDTILIAQPEQFYLEMIHIKHNLCYQGDDGEIIVTEFGGVAPYISYFIADSLNNVVAGISNIYTNLISSDYSLWSIDSNGCISDTLSGVKLGEPGKIIAQTNVTSLDCFESHNGVVDLLILSGTPPYQYSLVDDNFVLAQGNIAQSVSLSIYDLYSSDFTLYVSDYNSCEIDTQIVVSQPQEVVANFVTNNTFGREQFTTSFENLSLGSDIFIWDFADGVLEYKDLDDEVAHTFVNQGEYMIQLIANNSNLSDLCNDTATLIIDVEGYDVFNSFSPNNDNVNDIFHFNDWMIEGIDVEIFNRWGQQVYHWSGIDGYWDGRSYNGEKLPEGVYFYQMKAQGVDGYSFQEKGSITLLR